MKPSVSRVVHYVSHGTPVREDGGQAHASRCRAAIITVVHGRGLDPASLDETDAWDVGLAVLNPTGLFFDEHCMQHESAAGDYWGGSWHWPERVEE
ncbi:hypothetical protein ACIRLA_46490 [Streptomyces sp. NPDC102364]|uniref:hypothetical protein n=1 Tax=Streptomyces sp. NPDC102364 TaxID=3366161 RepID=UPI0038090186